MKFKIGDKVRIKTEEELIQEFGTFYYDDHPSIVNSMFNLLGKIATIRDISHGIDVDFLIKLEEDPNNYNFHPKWLKKVSYIKLKDDLFKI